MFFLLVLNKTMSGFHIDNCCTPCIITSNDPCNPCPCPPVTGPCCSSITYAYVDNNGYLIFVDSCGRVSVIGRILGPTGASVTGSTGDIGPMGHRVVNCQVSNNDLIITMSDGTVYDAGNVRGNTGSEGIQGKVGVGVVGSRIDNNNLILTLSNNEELNAGSVVGPTGAASKIPGPSGYSTNTGATGATGVGISSASVDANGDLIIDLTDDKSIVAGNVRGAPGIGVNSVTVRPSDGMLIVSYTDDSSTNAGSTRGPTGNGLVSMSIDLDGQVTALYTNKTSQVIGGISKVYTGPSGVGVQNIVFDSKTRDLNFYMSNNNTITAGRLPVTVGQLPDSFFYTLNSGVPGGPGANAVWTRYPFNRSSTNNIGYVTLIGTGQFQFLKQGTYRVFANISYLYGSALQLSVRRLPLLTPVTDSIVSNTSAYFTIQIAQPNEQYDLAYFARMVPDTPQWAMGDPVASGNPETYGSITFELIQ